MSLFNNQAGLSFAEDAFNIKANFLERDRVQLENRIFDLKEALKINKELIQTLVMGADNLEVSEKLQKENNLLHQAIERTQFERDEAQAKLLIAEQVRKDAERKEIDAIREKKELEHEFAEEKQLQEYRIQYLENQYKKFELIVHENAQKNPTLERKLREAKFEVPSVKKLANVVNENEQFRIQMQEKNREIQELNKELDRHVELLANHELQYRVDRYKQEEERKEQNYYNTAGAGREAPATETSFTLAKNYCDTSINARKGRIDILRQHQIMTQPQQKQKVGGKTPTKKLSSIPKLDLSQTRSGQALDKRSLYAYIEKLEKMNKYHILRITNLENDNLALDRQNQKLKAKLRQLNETSVLNQTLNLSGIAPLTHQRSGTMLFERGGGDTLLIGESAMTPRKRDQEDLFGLVTYRGRPEQQMKYSPFTAMPEASKNDKSQNEMFSYLLGKTTHNISGVFGNEMGDEEDVDNLKALSGSEFEGMDDEEYVQAVEERVQRGKGEGMKAKQELLQALQEKED